MTKPMNRKAEFVLLSLFLAVVVVSGIVLINDLVLEKERVINFVGDTSHKVVYNLQSKNPNCNLNSIVVEKQNVKLFNSEEEYTKLGFKIDKNCS